MIIKHGMLRSTEMLRSSACTHAVIQYRGGQTKPGGGVFPQVIKT